MLSSGLQYTWHSIKACLWGGHLLRSPCREGATRGEQKKVSTDLLSQIRRCLKFKTTLLEDAIREATRLRQNCCPVRRISYRARDARRRRVRNQQGERHGIHHTFSRRTLVPGTRWAALVAEEIGGSSARPHGGGLPPEPGTAGPTSQLHCSPHSGASPKAPSTTRLSTAARTNSFALLLGPAPWPHHFPPEKSSKPAGTLPFQRLLLTCPPLIAAHTPHGAQYLFYDDVCTSCCCPWLGSSLKEDASPS